MFIHSGGLFVTNAYIKTIIVNLWNTVIFLSKNKTNRFFVGVLRLQTYFLMSTGCDILFMPSFIFSSGLSLDVEISLLPTFPFPHKLQLHCWKVWLCLLFVFIAESYFLQKHRLCYRFQRAHRMCFTLTLTMLGL